MRKQIAVLSAVLTLTGCSAKVIQNEPKPADNTVYTRESAGIRLEDDFYGYMDFDLLYSTDIPAGMQQAGTIRTVQKNTDDIISGEIISIGGSDEVYISGSAEQKIHDLYVQYLDKDTREVQGLAPLEDGFKEIDAACTADGFVRACGKLYTQFGVSVLPAVGVTQDLYDSSRNIPYIGHMQLCYTADELLHGKDTAEDLQQLLTEILKASGHSDAESLARDTVTMILEIAESTADTDNMPEEDMYNRFKPDELDPLVSGYLDAAGMGGRDILVTDTAHAEKICSLLTDDNISLWKALAECMLIYNYKDYLPPEYAEAFEQADHQTDEGKAVQAVKKLLDKEVGEIYARKYRDEKTFAAVRGMTDDIISAYRKCIESSELLNENDRRECLAKIDNIRVNIGCPDEAAHSAELSDDLLGSAVSIKSGVIREMLSSADGAPKADDRGMPAYAANAYYDPHRNSITVPMGIFAPPIFDADADYYTDLGELGSVIAHELSHAFDADGILYDENGNYRPDRISTQRTDLLSEKVAAYFGGMQIMDTFYINGENTKCENAADLGGMQVIASMTDEREELRRIFESYAVLWATLSYDTDASEQIGSNVHSPAEIRVNGVLSSVDKFYTAYDISENDGMYVQYDKRVRMW